MRKFSLIVMLFLVGGLFAANWTDDGHGGVYWTMNNYTISAFPKTATSNGVNFLQYVNFTSTNPNPILANLSFVFDEAPSSGSISIWRNTTTRLNSSYTIFGVTNFSVSTANCSIGDNLNLYKYNVTYTGGYNNSSLNGIACFDSYTQNGSDYTVMYSYNNWIGWENILSQFYYTQVANHHVWTYNNVPFNGSTNYQTKFEYSFPQVISTANGVTIQKLYNGKFDIFAHSGSPNDVINGVGTTYVVLDPYYNSTGGAVTYDGNYTVVTYTANGTFNVTGEINATVLVVAGGGGGGGRWSTGIGGGGGAGGLIYNTSYNATGNITVTIGNGGAKAANTQKAVGGKGVNSSFGTLQANGGGGGGTYDDGAGGNGGSGGGGAQALGVGGTGTTGQGYNGGTAKPNSGAGGGGAGGIGGNVTAVGAGGGLGGVGINYTINGSTVCYAGGGGGGTHGAVAGFAVGGCPMSGNGSGTTSTPAVVGMANSGGGGGGGGELQDGAAGGSGIVIIRYLTYSGGVSTGTLTVNSTAGGSATGNNSTFTPPANLTINATASAGYYFSNWTENCNGTVANTTNNNTQIEVLDATACYAQANFKYNISMITSTILPSPAYNTSTLIGWCNATTNDSTNITYNYKWYLNGTLNVTGTFPIVQASAIGGTITTIIEDGTNYTVHTFTSNSTFNVTGTINATVLVVAGGGGGGGRWGTGIGGGGGAGGLIYNTSYNATGNITVTIGNGGAKAANTQKAVGGKGVNSSFGTLQANGGGGGGTYDDGAGGNGGSGGGGAQALGVGGTGTTGQGYNGGTAKPNSGAGGGGAGGIGGNVTANGAGGGLGGVGINYTINGSTVCYAGGGGGGTHNAVAGFAVGGCPMSGNGSGTTNTPAVVGMANSGGGGGGGGELQDGAAGGSGIVIVRYITSGSTSSTVTQGITTNVANVSNTSLVTGQNWTLECSAYNANGSSDALNSSVTTIVVESSLGCGILGTAGQTYTMTGNVSIDSANCFLIQAENVTLDCNGYTITTTTWGVGVGGGDINSTIKNCKINSAYEGIALTHTNGTATISNLTISTPYGTGIQLEGFVNSIINGVNLPDSGIVITGNGYSNGDNVSVINSYISPIGEIGIAIESPSCSAINVTLIGDGTRNGVYMLTTNTTIQKCSIKNFDVGIYLDGAINNTICLNNFTDFTEISYYISDTTGSNFYNCTYEGKNQGNIYENVINGSIVVTGTVASSIPGFYIGTSGAGVPYSNSTSGGKFSCNFAGCADYAPLTNWTVSTAYYSVIGTSTSWVWGQLKTGNTTISGNETNWTWRTWEPGSGRKIRNGTPYNWSWVAE
jgi:hypothetical protein